MSASGKEGPHAGAAGGPPGRAEPITAVARPASCWRIIGVHGDHSCPELVTHIHCRNCPVFTAAGRELLARPAPPGYREQWGALLAAEKPAHIEERSLIVFRVAAEWLALDTKIGVEVAEPRPIHAVPHRARDVLLGLVNVRGELMPCMSLHGLLRIGGAGDGRMPARLLVIEQRGESWALAVDGVAGAHRCPVASIQEVPTTVAHGLHPFTAGVIPVFSALGGELARHGAGGHHDTVGLLDGERVIAALRERLG